MFFFSQKCVLKNVDFLVGCFFVFSIFNDEGFKKISWKQILVRNFLIFSRIRRWRFVFRVNFFSHSVSLKIGISLKGRNFGVVHLYDALWLIDLASARLAPSRGDFKIKGALRSKLREAPPTEFIFRQIWVSNFIPFCKTPEKITLK